MDEIFTATIVTVIVPNRDDMFPVGEAIGLLSSCLRSDGASVIPIDGYWQGKLEPMVKVEIAVPGSIDGVRARRLFDMIGKLRQEYGETCVYVECRKASVGLVWEVGLLPLGEEPGWQDGESGQEVRERG